MKIYTRTGDAGETGLFGGGRVSKADARVEAYGTIDELNAVIGWTIAKLGDPGEWKSRLQIIQADLLTIGAHLATPEPKGRRRKPDLPALPVGRVEELEAWIDDADASLPPLRAFILPGGHEAGAALHIARTVCRRAERDVVRLSSHDSVDPFIVKYLNRLSDLLFTAARSVNHAAGIPETEWHPDATP